MNVPLLTRPANPPADPQLATAHHDHARAELTFLLQLAYSGELAATRAYLGHRATLRDARERSELGRIIRDEVRHRHCVLKMLTDLGAGPDPYRERKMNTVGRLISTACQLGGWFFPMYGAGRLEAQNVREYEVAARLALLAELPHCIEPCLEMAEVEWDHEDYFHAKASSHFLWRFMPSWRRPGARTDVRASFQEFRTSHHRGVQAVRAPLLIR